MAKVISNEYLGENMYILKVSGIFKGKMGQFYMLRAWENYPLLSRPISIHDIGEDYISFLYKVVGKGTKILSELKPYDDIKLEGPYGNGFEEVKGKIALVGGGMGIAPLYLAAKTLKNVDVYMGFREKAVLEDKFKKYSNEVNITVGRNITDILDVNKYDYILTCGPEIMMKKIVDMAKGTNTKVYVSIENKMACGVGACLVCTCKTKQGNKKTCKDGPVFLGEEVLFDE
ncbi:dihydroorotate dehydrogenase electron transfer subunit [Tepidibacter formicigenes]|jgi:dihydroorotate dehydrogenase electron transfer subunit|uniref:Dihydroorotate dehydrogenase electron transfer subunit n=1 Tax=Tepidibacter formicigenes DSM 15518 TaxID=1123349 RepID=A0A1M6PTD8_9FIRM|nr:dihydroorotate dehydrogenase electron transfer subunit [Tepidibacter formicigenes]SHK11229.1 dihydroorotate dehydrogenase electron transfer subunit [Tepidibacter formicigenes DSM 15518]